VSRVWLGLRGLATPAVRGAHADVGRAWVFVCWTPGVRGAHAGVGRAWVFVCWTPGVRGAHAGVGRAWVFVCWTPGVRGAHAGVGRAWVFVCWTPGVRGAHARVNRCRPRASVARRPRVGSARKPEAGEGRTAEIVGDKEEWGNGGRRLDVDRSRGAASRSWSLGSSTSTPLFPLPIPRRRALGATRRVIARFAARR